MQQHDDKPDWHRLSKDLQCDALALFSDTLQYAYVAAAIHNYENTTFECLVRLELLLAVMIRRTMRKRDAFAPCAACAI